MNLITLTDACSYIGVSKKEMCRFLEQKEKQHSLKLLTFHEGYGDELVLKKELIKRVEKSVQELYSMALPIDYIKKGKTEVLPLWSTGMYVYFLFNNDDIVYIGQSEDLLGRITTHVKDSDKVFNSVSLLKLDTKDKEEVLFMEALYIHTYKPPLNKTKCWATLVRRAIDNVNVDFLD